MNSILSLVALDPQQRETVTRCNADIVVTAGAGSGKTRALVGRYLALLEGGAPLRSLIAITFADKAAREMRTHIRRFVAEWLTRLTPHPHLGDGGEVFAELDAARIGTLHSLCAVILRAHPAEAGVDPAFDVLDENATAALRAQAIETALAWAANDAEAAPLFALLKENALREMPGALLEKRLDAQTAFDVTRDPRAVWEAALMRALAEYADAPAVRDALATLRGLRDAEEKRLLYVAATRAKEKLIISGHTKRKKDGTLSLGGWLEQLGALVGLDTAAVPETFTAPVRIELNPLGGTIGCVVAPLGALEVGSSKLEVGSDVQSPTSNLQPPPLIAPLLAPPSEHSDDKLRAREVEPPPRVWRVVPTARRPRGPAWVVGKLVHEALRRWRFPDRADFHVFLYPHALAAGLTDPVEISETIADARRLLARFQTHALFAEMQAAERFHEVPFTFRQDDCVETGVIDVLYRAGETWWLVDFKTDEIRDEEQLEEKIAEYREQVARYAGAVCALIGAMPETRLCFLDVQGEVRVVTANLPNGLNMPKVPND